MLAMHPIHLSNEKAGRSLSELEYFLADLSQINLDELQRTLTPEPLRVRTHLKRKLSLQAID